MKFAYEREGSVSSIILLLLKASIILNLLGTTEGHIILETGSEFSSQPAAFGKLFQYGVHYEARVQVIHDDPYLCADEDGVIPKNPPHRQPDKIIAPQDGLPGEWIQTLTLADSHFIISFQCFFDVLLLLLPSVIDGQ